MNGKITQSEQHPSNGRRVDESCLQVLLENGGRLGTWFVLSSRLVIFSECSPNRITVILLFSFSIVHPENPLPFLSDAFCISDTIWTNMQEQPTMLLISLFLSKGRITMLVLPHVAVKSAQMTTKTVRFPQAHAEAIKYGQGRGFCRVIEDPARR